MIRHAHIDDLEVIVDIYNQAIASWFQTAFTEPQDVAGRIDWFNGHDRHFPLFVYDVDGDVAGWLSIAPYRAGRGALRHTVEISYFIDRNFRHQGIGTRLLDYGINAARQLGYKTALAIIIDANVASINLVEKFGFEQWGLLPGAVEFDGQECNHLYYGLKL